MHTTFFRTKICENFRRVRKILKISKKHKEFVFNPKLFHPQIEGKAKGLFFDFLTKGKQNYLQSSNSSNHRRISITASVSISATGMANQMPGTPSHRGSRRKLGTRSTVRRMTMSVARRMFSRLW